MKNFFHKHNTKLQNETMSSSTLSEQHRADLFNHLTSIGESLVAKTDDEKSLVLGLCELFSEMDFNGDRFIEWEDFTSYLIEAATDQHLRLQDRIKEYSLRKEVSGSEIEDSIKKICYFENWDRVVTCGKTKKCKILDPENELQTIAILPDHDGTILNAEYIPAPYHILVTSSADLCIRFWSSIDDEYDLTHHEQLDASQTVIKYYEKKDVLFTASRTGHITSWKWGAAPEDASKKKLQQSPFSTSPAKGMSGVRKSGMFSFQLDNSVRESFYRQKSFQLHDDVIMDMILMPKEERMITCSLDSKIKIYDIEKEKVRNVLSGHKQGVFAVTWSNDYHFLVSAGFEHEALVWIANVETAPFKLRDQKKPHQHSLVNVHAVPNSPQVITADHKGVVKIWDIRTFQCMQTIYTENNLPKNDYKNFYLNSFAYIPKRKQIVTAGKKMHIFEYERTQNPTCADDQPLFTAIYNPMSFTFMTAAGRDIKIWDALTGCISRVYKNITDSEITALCTDDRCRKFFVGTHDGDIICFNYSNGRFVKSFAKHESEVSSLIYTDEDTKQLISTSWDSTIRIMDDRDSSEGHIYKFKPLGFHPEDIKCASWSKSLNILVSGDISNKICVFDTKNGNKLQECNSKNKAEAVALKFLGSLPAFIATDTQGFIRMWTVKPYLYPYQMLLEWRNNSLQKNRSSSIDEPSYDMEDLNTLPNESVTESRERRQFASPVTAIDFDPTTNYLYTGDVRGYISVWDLTDIIEEAHLKYSIRHSSSANINDIRNSIEGFSMLKMTRKFYWKAHSDAIRYIQIIKDPASIITCAYDSRVIIWTKSGQQMDSLRQENSDDVAADYKSDEEDSSNEPIKRRQPFNFPINLDRRRKNDVTTVSHVIGKIKRQLRIVNLWKSKSKSSLVARSIPLPQSQPNLLAMRNYNSDQRNLSSQSSAPDLLQVAATSPTSTGTASLPSIQSPDVKNKHSVTFMDDVSSNHSKGSAHSRSSSLRLPSISTSLMSPRNEDKDTDSFYITQQRHTTQQ